MFNLQPAPVGREYAQIGNDLLLRIESVGVLDLLFHCENEWVFSLTIAGNILRAGHDVQLVFAAPCSVRQEGENSSRQASRASLRWQVLVPRRPQGLQSLDNSHAAT